MPLPSVRADADACPGALRLHAAADGPLARVRVPGGRMTGAQLAAVHELATRWGDGRVELTSRANLQLRALKDAPVEQLAARLRDAGLLPSETHELVRNIVASPLSGGLPVGALDRALCADPALTELPGRFLFALDGGPGDVAFDADVAALPLDGEVAIIFAGVDAGLRVPPAEVVTALLAGAHAFLAERAAQTPRSTPSWSPAGWSGERSAPHGSSEEPLSPPGRGPDAPPSGGSTAGGRQPSEELPSPPSGEPGVPPSGRPAGDEPRPFEDPHSPPSGDPDAPHHGGPDTAPTGDSEVLLSGGPGAGGRGPSEDSLSSPGGLLNAPHRGGLDVPPSGGLDAGGRQPSEGPLSPPGGRPDAGGRLAWRVRELTDGPARVAARTAAALGRTLGEPVRRSRPGLREPIGIIEQADGRVAVGALVPLGRLSDVQLKVLASAEALVFTPWRGVVLPDLAPQAAERWVAALAGAGLEAAAGSRWTGVTACAGRPGCAKALADVRADADAATVAGEGLPVHWVGCARACGSPAGPHVRVEATGTGYEVRSPYAGGITSVGGVGALVGAARKG